MKNSAWYTKLWQSKMQELPIQGDGHNAWQKMQGLLDHHLPVSTPVVIKPKPTTSLVLKLAYILIGAIAAVTLYYGINKALLNHHKKTSKPVEKHTRIATDSIINKNTTSTIAGNNADIDKKSNDSGVNQDQQSTTSSSGVAAVSSLIKTKNSAVSVLNSNTVTNTNNLKGIANTTTELNAESSNGKSRIIGGNDKRIPIKNSHLTNQRNNNRIANQANNSHNQHTRRLASNYNLYNLKNGNNTIVASTNSNNNHQLLLDQSTIKTNTMRSTNNGNSLKADTLSNTTQSNNIENSSVSTTHTTTANTSTLKQGADSKAKNQSKTPNSKTKTSSAKKSSDSQIGFDVNLGANTNQGSSLDPFFGIAGTYNFSNKLGLSIGVNLPSTRIISGSYSNSNLSYVNAGDSSKKIAPSSGQLKISSTRKILYVDIPILATYQLLDKLSIIAGPVISVPFRSGVNKNGLGPANNSADSTTLSKVTPYVASTTINSKINFSFSAGLQYNLNRFYFDADYLQGLSPYTISSGLGSDKVNYHTFQIGVGYHLIKAKRKQ